MLQVIQVGTLGVEDGLEVGRMQVVHDSIPASAAIPASPISSALDVGHGLADAYLVERAQNGQCVGHDFPSGYMTGLSGALPHDREPLCQAQDFNFAAIIYLASGAINSG